MTPVIRNDFEHSLLHYMSSELLAKIQRAHIGIAGAGGLGSNIAHTLVRTGVINFTIADFDKVQMHNLNRQLFFTDDVGRDKVKSISDTLKRINSDLNINSYVLRITEDNASSIFNDCDIIFEAFDEASSKKMMFEKMSNSGKILVFGSGISGFSMEGESINIRNISKNIYIIGCNNKEVDNDNPPFASKVMAIANVMANIGINCFIKRINK